MKFYYITFRSVTYAQRGEKILSQAGVKCTLLRTPKWMEVQGCGYSLRLWTDDVHHGIELLRRAGVVYRRVYIQLPDGILEELDE